MRRESWWSDVVLGAVVALILVMASTSKGAEVPVPRKAPKVSTVAIEGPTELTVGKAGKFKLVGLSLDDYLKAAKAKQITVRVFPKSAELEGGFDLSDLSVIIKVLPSIAGEHTLLVTRHNPCEEIEVTLQAKGGTNPPNPPQPPTPDPDPKPVPGDKYQIAIVLESADLTKLTKGQLEVTSGLTFREELEKKGHRFLGLLEVSQKGNASKADAPFFQAVDSSGIKLPCVAVAPLSGGSIRVFPLPEASAFYSTLDGSK